MRTRTSIPPGRGPWPLLGAATVLVLALLGAAMADAHDPIALEPDAPRADGAAVATFALG